MMLVQRGGGSALKGRLIRRHIAADGPSPWRDDELGLVREGDYNAFFAPFDWINEQADIIIVGVTSGKQQALEVLLTFRAALAGGSSLDELAGQAKGAESFKGGIRSLGARLMDHFGLTIPAWGLCQL